VLIPGFLAQAETVSLLPQLPNLRLVQLRSAGAERWLGLLPGAFELEQLAVDRSSAAIALACAHRARPQMDS